MNLKTTFHLASVPSKTPSKASRGAFDSPGTPGASSSLPEPQSPTGCFCPPCCTLCTPSTRTRTRFPSSDLSMWRVANVLLLSSSFFFMENELARWAAELEVEAIGAREACNTMVNELGGTTTGLLAQLKEVNAHLLKLRLLRTNSEELVTLEVEKAVATAVEDLNIRLARATRRTKRGEEDMKRVHALVAEQEQEMRLLRTRVGELETLNRERERINNQVQNQLQEVQRLLQENELQLEKEREIQRVRDQERECKVQKLSYELSIKQNIPLSKNNQVENLLPQSQPSMQVFEIPNTSPRESLLKQRTKPPTTLPLKRQPSRQANKLLRTVKIQSRTPSKTNRKFQPGTTQQSRTRTLI